MGQKEYFKFMMPVCLLFFMSLITVTNFYALSFLQITMSVKNRAYKASLKENYKLLLRCVDPTDELLSHLKSVDQICDKVTRIKSKKTEKKKVSDLLSTLIELPDDAMSGFVAALQVTDQIHVVNVFKKHSNAIPMSDEHYRVLCDKLGELRLSLEPRNELLDRMVSAGAFTDDERSVILSKRDVDKMVQKTIEILQRKPDDAFDKFTTALTETGQDHVIYVLTNGTAGRAPMSAEHRELLLTKRGMLRKFLDPLNGVLDELVCAKELSEQDDRRIRSDSDVTGKLLEALTRKPDDAFRVLIEALNKTQQQHVVYILTGEGSSRPICEEFQQRLTESRLDLIDKIDSRSTSLISFLISKSVFTTDDQKRVCGSRQHAEPDHAQNERILDLIACKSQESFVNFIAALNETGQQHISLAIIGAEVVAKMIARCEGDDRNHDEYDFNQELLHYIHRLCENNDDYNIRKLKQYLSARGISVSNVKEGCIQITFACKDLESLDKLRELKTSGELNSLFSETFCPRFAERGLISLAVNIPDDEFEKCSSAFKDLKLMTSEHRETLDSAAEWLAAELTVNDDLLDKLSLSGHRREAIQRARTRDERVKKLLYLVSRRPDAAFAQFLDALDGTQQRFTADKLRRRPTSGGNGGNDDSSCKCFEVFLSHRIQLRLKSKELRITRTSHKFPRVPEIFSCMI